MTSSVRLSARAARVEPFHVMEVAKAAQNEARRRASAARATGGAPQRVIFLNIGEPDGAAPPLVQQAAERALRDGRTQYTAATGLPELRERIAGWYATRFGLDVPARRIVVTAGASAALQLACLALLDTGDEVLMPDPCYPCNRNFVAAAGGEAVLMPTTAAERFQPSADKAAAAWTPRTRGLLLATPSNPTGTSIDPDELRHIHALAADRGGFTLVDEIYLGLCHEPRYGQSALALGDDILSVNSFSKYFGMTGWRLGWLVVPESLVAGVERLAQHLYICPSTLAQHAALACFEPESLAEFERRRDAFRARRDYFVPALAAAGLPVPVMPDGAFYAWADARAACERLGVEDAWALAFALLERAGLAVTPGRDFGHAGTAHALRFSTAGSMEDLQEAAARLHALLA